MAVSVPLVGEVALDIHIPANNLNGIRVVAGFVLFAVGLPFH